jgi:hypothetical protein
LYLLYKLRTPTYNILFGAVTFGLIYGFIFDFLAELNKAWSWNGGLIFGKILDVVQIDVLIWFFMWTLNIFLFYEYFIDRKRMASIGTKQGIAIAITGVISVCILTIIYYAYPDFLLFQKAYLTLCIGICIPFIIGIFQKPQLILRTAPVMIYFAFVYLAHEITALHLEQWTFPGDYIGWVAMFGVTFPIEEFVFWIILSSLIGAIYYEMSFDNQEN